MRALITGATGYIGTGLARHLRAAGWDLHVLLRASSDPAKLTASLPDIECHRLAGANEGAAVALVERVRPDCVFHLASRIQPSHTASEIEPLISSNVTLGVELLEGLSRINADRRGEPPSVLVAAGTYWAYGPDGEDAPNTLYAASKRAFESFLPFYARHRGVPGSSLVLYDVYGPHDPRGKLIPALVDNALAPDGGTLALSPGDQLMQLVFLDDVVRGFVMAAEGLQSSAIEPGRYCLDSGDPVSLKTLVAEIATAAGRAPAVEFGARPYPPNQIMVPLQTGPRLPGWSPGVSLTQGLQALLSARSEAP